MNFQSGHWGFRIFVAGLAFSIFISLTLAIFNELSQTNDFVLENRYLLVGGTWGTGAGLAVLIFILSRPNAENPQQKGNNKNS
jgi:hypothetical protein